jgi:hypothetical protein
MAKLCRGRIAELASRQPTLRRENLLLMVRLFGAPHEPALIYWTDHGLLLFDGHHRAAALLLLGMSHIAGLVLDVREP